MFVYLYYVDIYCCGWLRSQNVSSDWCRTHKHSIYWSDQHPTDINKFCTELCLVVLQYRTLSVMPRGAGGGGV